MVTELRSSISVTESVFLQINKTSSTPSMFIAGLYIPPNKPAEPYSNFCDVIEEFLCTGPNYDAVLLIGDFNLPDVNWSGISPSASNKSSQLLLDLMSLHRLYQINRVLNARGVLLDLVFSSNENCVVSPATDPVLPSEAAHPPLQIEVPMHTCRPTSNVTLNYNFMRCNIQEIYNEMSRYCGEVFYNIPDSNDFFCEFHKTIHDIVLKHTPLKRGGVCRFPSWFSPELRIAVVRKKILHRNYKVTGNFGHYMEFQRARRHCNMLSNLCYATYMEQVNNCIPLNIKAFWSFVKNLKSDSTRVNEYFLGDHRESSPEGICNLFADYFSSVYRPTVNLTPQFDYSTQINMSSCSFTVEDVERQLSSLDTSKGTGPDLIPPSVLRFCAPILAPQLTVIFNRLLEDGVFPDGLKSCFIVPIHKSSDSSDVRNYRPIAIQPVLGKIFESLVLDHISFSFKNIIAPQQHGFTRGRSTVSNLVVYENYILTAFSSGIQVDSVYIDFSKAFDAISHRHLLAKLHGYGISGSLLSWFHSYLNDRTFLVRFAGALSMPFTATSGVPQGSRLGPFLFNIYINDLVKSLNVDCLMFADDVKLYRAIRDLSDSETLQMNLSIIENWCITNVMNINAAKCSLVSFTRSAQPPIVFDYVLNGTVLTRSTTVRDLGVVFSADLTPEKHIDFVCGKALRMLSFILRASKCGLGIKALNILYKSLVRSILEYCSVVWCPYQLNHIERLDRIQRRFIRAVGSRLGYNYADVPIDAVEASLGLLPLSTRRQQADALFLWGVLRGTVDCPDILCHFELRASRLTRSSNLFFCRSHPTNYVMHGPLPRLHRLGNKLCHQFDFFDDSQSSLRRIFQG